MWKETHGVFFLNLGNPNHSYVFQQSVKVKVTPQQAEVAQGVPGRLRPRPDFLDVRHYEGGRSSAIRTGEIPGTNFQWLSRPQCTWFRRGEPRKKSPVTPPGIDPGTV